MINVVLFTVGNLDAELHLCAVYLNLKPDIFPCQTHLVSQSVIQSVNSSSTCMNPSSDSKLLFGQKHHD